MADDTPTLLCTPEQFQSGPLGDLVKDYDSGMLTDVLTEATRICEDETDRRLVPFTVTETHRAMGIDPDEYSDAANLPMDIQSTLGASYAQAIGANSLVRHCWLDQKAPRYPDMWQYSDVSVTIIRSYGGTQAVAPTQILNGPENETGHMWFQLGLFLPVGSRIQVQYSGGYVKAIPRSLVRACKFMGAYLVVRDLNPDDATHDPDQLHADALLALTPWVRDD